MLLLCVLGVVCHPHMLLFFLLQHTGPTEIYPLSLHDALPISVVRLPGGADVVDADLVAVHAVQRGRRSEEHTSELQSLTNLVCRLLLEKKNKETTEA